MTGQNGRMADSQITRNNHYVPQWYQRGFLSKGQHKLHVLNLAPSPGENKLEQRGPKRAFVELDLYTTRFGNELNDEIERFLFGEIDATGADALRDWLSGDLVRIHRNFLAFFEYLDAQKLRTPKGLDWIQAQFQSLPHIALMVQMQALRKMHATMWSECVREIVSARNASVKFLISDHPVTVCHPMLDPQTQECAYPNDPGIELIGSQTLFPLDANNCLILTNLEYASDPKSAKLLNRRTNARFRGSSIARTDAFIRDRELTDAEVHAFNRILKDRARKYVAASKPEWLHPEEHCRLKWRELATLLLPKKELWRFGGEVYIGHGDGTTSYRDAFGRTSKAHEDLAKKPPDTDPDPGAACGCGSGVAFSQCCSGVAIHRRPPWDVLSIRERNLILCNAVYRILGLADGKTWLDVRRDLSDEQVRRINRLYACLWPKDTQLAELLPRPQDRRSRALYLGTVDPHTLNTSVTGLLPYFDELVLSHPFVNSHGVRPEYSPIESPAKYKEQTLRNVYVLLILEPFIQVGRIHLVPDPMDYDEGFRQEIKGIVDSLQGEANELGPNDRALADAMSRDMYVRAIRRLPPDKMRAFFKQQTASARDEFSDDDIEAAVVDFLRQNEEDHLALLQPIATSKEAGELQMMKGFGRETGLYVASLTGSFIYTASEMHWNRLHRSDGVHDYRPDPEGAAAVEHLGRLALETPEDFYVHPEEPQSAQADRRSIREIALLLSKGDEWKPSGMGDTLALPSQLSSHSTVKLGVVASVPLGGFLRTDVSRLVLTFGRTADVASVRLLLLVRPGVSTQQGPSGSPG
jgi:hypothetical protein